jgi:hypothetical protein
MIKELVDALHISHFFVVIIFLIQKVGIKIKSKMWM